MSDGGQLIGDADLSGLWVQPGFVEGIIADRKSFESLADAYRHVFRRNLEYIVLLWNGIPVRLSYQADLPALVDGLTVLLAAVLSPTPTRCGYAFQTPSVQCLWQLESDADGVMIEGYWQSIAGLYEMALNQVGNIRMARLAFLCEWKLLLRQLVQAISDAEASLSQPQARAQLAEIQRIEQAIPALGRFYQYTSAARR